MPLLWDVSAWDDYTDWSRADTRILDRINQLVREIQQQGHAGMGRPQPLIDANGYHQRRITDEHRLVYKIKGDDVLIAACRYHH